MTDFPLDQIDRLMMTTKQVRKRLDLTRKVPLDTVLHCIDVASCAPVGGNHEWNRWLLIEDDETKQEMAKIYRKSAVDYMAQSKAQVEEAGGDPTQRRVVDSGSYLTDHIHEVPLMIIPIRFGEPGDTLFDQSGFYGSIFPSIWSLQMSLRARGIGSALTTLHLHHEAEARELLGIPDTVTQLALMPAAFYTGETFSPTKRKPAKEIAYLNRWKEQVQ